MKTLIVEGDFERRVVLLEFLSRYSECHIAVNGMESVGALRSADAHRRMYDLICMDTTMVGTEVWEAIRSIRGQGEPQGEEGADISSPSPKIILTTAPTNAENVIAPLEVLCDASLSKPIDTAQLLDHLKDFGLVFDDRDSGDLDPEDLPGSDLDDFSLLRDLPAHLWMHFYPELIGTSPSWLPDQRRIEFKLLDRWVSLDPRYVARLYRSWWARLGFFLEVGTTLQNFAKKETEYWPKAKETRPKGRPKQAEPEPQKEEPQKEKSKPDWVFDPPKYRVIHLRDFTEAVGKSKNGRHHTFERLHPNP
jgi:two-component system, chemotaxis family, chemotaxis protein CheY